MVIPTPAPAFWIDDMDRSAAEIAAGLTVPVEPILEELRASADRLEARLRDLAPDSSIGSARRG